MSLARLTARYDAWSLSDHSHSRLLRKPSWLGNVSLLTVVSIWKILTCSSSTPAIRSYEWCIAEFGGSLNERELRRGCTWWGGLRLRHEARRTETDFRPPLTAVAPRLTQPTRPR